MGSIAAVGCCEGLWVMKPSGMSRINVSMRSTPRTKSRNGVRRWSVAALGAGLECEIDKPFWTGENTETKDGQQKRAIRCPPLP